MGRSFYKLQASNAIEDFAKNNRYYHPASDTHYEMVERGGKYYQQRYQTGFDGKPANLDEKQIDFVMGSGTHARTYLHRVSDGGLFQLPLGWYAEKGGYWAMSPGYDTANHPGSRRPIGYDCMFCHNAYPKIPPGQDRYGERPIFTGALPEGIDCQRCHGAGDAHVKAAQARGRSEDVRKAIANPARLSSERQMEVCMQCHLESNSFQLPHAVRRYDRSFFTYKAGEPLSALMLFFDTADRGERDDRFQIVSSVYRLQKSECFVKSKGTLGCTTCHDPHQDQHGVAAQTHYNEVCKQCHAAALDKLITATRHTAQPDCVTCHMQQRRTDDVVHVAMTDHLIRRQQQVQEPLAEKAEHRETEANGYRGEVIRMNPGIEDGRKDDRLYVAIAQVRDKSNLEQGVPQLAEILQSQRPQLPEPYLELAEAFKSLGRLKQAIPLYEEALRRDPKYLPALLELGNAWKDSGETERATGTFARATQLAPSDARTWSELGQVYINARKNAEAVGALQHAATLDPEMAEPHNGFAILLAQTGEADRAAAEFREAIRLQPNYVDAHSNLANLLTLQNALPEAAFEFKRAILLQPGDAVAHFNYGSMLNTARQFDEAQTQVEAAVTADPDFAEARDLLGNLWERRGRIDDALQEYRLAVQFRPELSRAQLDLGATLAKKGDKQGAAEHLKLAAKSTDATLRKIALQLLSELGS